ncbi:hypothetical protein LY76DRAFT_282566 [Colletotrichum caudatum]|nr:hypothetical protein LY76DRAFT_282566 [Colletotrichum caudatum]
MSAYRPRVLTTPFNAYAGPGPNPTRPPTTRGRRRTNERAKPPPPPRVHGSYAGRCPSRSTNPRSCHQPNTTSSGVRRVVLGLVYEQPCSASYQRRGSASGDAHSTRA